MNDTHIVLITLYLIDERRLAKYAVVVNQNECGFRFHEAIERYNEYSGYWIQLCKAKPDTSDVISVEVIEDSLINPEPVKMLKGKEIETFQTASLVELSQKLQELHRLKIAQTELENQLITKVLVTDKSIKDTTTKDTDPCEQPSNKTKSKGREPLHMPVGPTHRQLNGTKWQMWERHTKGQLYHYWDCIDQELTTTTYPCNEHGWIDAHAYPCDSPLLDALIRTRDGQTATTKCNRPAMDRPYQWDIRGGVSHWMPQPQIPTSQANS